MAPQPHVASWDDPHERFLDEELLLEILFTPQVEPSSPFSSSTTSAAVVYASPVSAKFVYSDANVTGSSMTYPGMNSTYRGFSPARKGEYHGQMPFTADSPTGSSGDEGGAFVDEFGHEYGLGELEMSNAGSPTSTKASGDEGSGGGVGGVSSWSTEGNYATSEMELSASGSPLSAKEKRQLEMRRKRNRESMRRVRQRKRLEYSELKKLLPGLEARLNKLREMKLQQERNLASGAALALAQSSNGVAGAPGPGHPRAMKQLRDVENAFRRENAWLEQEIDKYEQAFVALHDTIEDLRENDLLTVAPLENDPFAWTSRVVEFLPQFHQTEMFEFVRHSVIEVVRQVEAAHKIQETPEEILGWRTRRTVNGAWIQFAVSKDFMHEDVDVIAHKTWLVNSQSHTIQATMPQNHNMKVLRVVNDNTIICARNLFFPGDETNYCTIYLLMRVKTAKGYVIAQRSLLPADCEVLKLHLGSKYSYVNVFYGIILERHFTVNDEGEKVLAPKGCKCTFGGLAGNGTEIYVNTWAKDLFIAMLRWENSCVGPLYRLV